MLPAENILQFREVKPRPMVLQLVRVLPDEEARHYLLGQVLKRIRKFDEQYNPHADPKVHARTVEKDFTKDQGQEFFIAVAIREGFIVAHLLARRLENYGKWWVHVEQMQLDKDCGMDVEQNRLVLQMLKSWQKETGSDGITTCAINDAHVKRLKRFYRFESANLILMRLQ